MSKTVPASKFREWEGLDHLGRVTHEMNCIFREISKDDFGIDGEIEVVKPKSDGGGYETTGGILKFQAKSGMSYVREDTPNSFSSPVKEKDLRLWHSATYPTLYIVYHPEDDQLYWKEIKSYVRETKNIWQPPFKIIFDKENDKYTSDCRDQLMELAEVSPPRIARQEKERLFANLLPITRIPRVWSAECEKTREEVQLEVEGWTPPFTCTGNRLFTLENLSKPYAKLRGVVREASVREEDLDTWWEKQEKKQDYVHLLNQLLGHHCHKCGLKYNFRHGRNYFPIEGNGKKEEVKRTWYNIRTGRKAGPRTVAKKYEYGHDTFWRHLAVKLRFFRIGDEWCLRIIPDYFFSVDGEEPFDSDKVGSYATRKKEKDKNKAVLNHLLFWTYVLTQNERGSTKDGKINFWLYDQPVLEMEMTPAWGVANFANPRDPAPFEPAEDAPSLFERE